MKIIGHILGGGQADAVTKLTKETGMDESQVNSALSSLAPALLSGLSAAMGSAKNTRIRVRATEMVRKKAMAFPMRVPSR